MRSTIARCSASAYAAARCASVDSAPMLRFTRVGFQTIVAAAALAIIDAASCSFRSTIRGPIPRRSKTRRIAGRQRTLRAPHRPWRPLPAAVERSESARRRDGTSRRCRSERRCRLRIRRVRKSPAFRSPTSTNVASSSTRPARISASGKRALSYVITSSNQIQSSARPCFVTRRSERSASSRSALR